MYGARKSQWKKITFMFGFVFKSAYLPWVLVGWHTITGGSIMSDLIGIAAGHLYIFLKDVLPTSPYKYNVLKTPKFIEKLVNKYYTVPNGNVGGVNPINQPQNDIRMGWRAFGGRAVRLG